MSDYSLENARFHWEEGWRRLREIEDSPAARRAADRIVAAVHEQLRRRLGSSFAADELAAAYGEGRDWADDIVFEHGEGLSDAQAAVDAAYWEHLRFAGDFAGGIRINTEETPND